MRDVAERREQRTSGPEPDGYLDDGQPYWLAGPDNYWNRLWSQSQGAEGNDTIQK